MGKALREGGVYFIGETAVDSEGRAIKDAPKRTPDTDPSQQPGAIGAQTPEERMGIAIANALRGQTSESKNSNGSKTSESDSDELPTLADLEDHLSGLTLDEVEALQKQDERKGAVSIYEARIEELEEK